MIVYYVHMFALTSKLKRYTVSIMKKRVLFLRDIDISCIFIDFSFPFKANLKNEKKYQIYGPQPTVTVLLIADLTVTVLWV